MTTRQYSPVAVLLASSVFLALSAASGFAQDRLSANSVAARPVSNGVTHVSPDLPSGPPADEFERSLSVDRVVNGTRVVGVGDIHGKVTVELEADGDGARFLVKLAGQADFNAVAYRGPIQAHGTGTTTFLAQKRVQFDDGRFQDAATEADVDFQTSIEQVTTSLPGTLGRVAKRIAWRRIATLKPQIEKVAAADTEAKIIAEFDQIAAQWLDELNQSTRLEQTIQLLNANRHLW